jgi:hypothetical protein
LNIAVDERKEEKPLEITTMLKLRNPPLESPYFKPCGKRAIENFNFIPIGLKKRDSAFLKKKRSKLLTKFSKKL